MREAARGASAMSTERRCEHRRARAEQPLVDGGAHSPRRPLRLSLCPDRQRETLPSPSLARFRSLPDTQCLKCPIFQALVTALQLCLSGTPMALRPALSPDQQWQRAPCREKRAPRSAALTPSQAPWTPEQRHLTRTPRFVGRLT